MPENKPSSEDPKANELEGVFGISKFLSIGALAKLIDGASVLVFLTAALYFWGYVYYAAYTERFGVDFHGISLPIQEYLISSWMGVLYMLLIIAAGLIALGVLDCALDALVEWIRKKWAPKRSFWRDRAIVVFDRYISFAASIIVTVAVLLLGGKIMINQAQRHADDIIKQMTRAIVYGPDGTPFEGSFVYLRNYGGVMLVREIGADGSVIGHRFIKESGYSGYSLLAAVETPSEIVPAVDPKEADPRVDSKGSGR